MTHNFSWRMVMWVGLVSALAIAGGSLSPLVLEGLLLAVLVSKVCLDERKANHRKASELG